MNKVIADRYMIVSSLGEGGMADVYLAIDTILNREVAIKILRGSLSKDPIALLRFQREANAVSKLDHPNVVDVYDVGEFEGRHYIVMEYVRGRTLKQLISQRGSLQKEEAVDIMTQLTGAVLHAHENNIIHRDIKPQNVLVKDDGTVKITDFGIALAHDAVQLTQSDAVLGSAHYLAPETTRGETPTNQIDIYALGIVFYELLTGSVPFNGDNPVQIAMKHLRENIPSVRDYNPTLPQSIENIIVKATVRNRSLRYQSAKEMLYDLEKCLLPEYVNQKQLSFDEEATPTLVMQHKTEARRPSQRKEKVIPIEEEEEKKTKSHRNMTKVMVVLVSIIAIAVLIATLFLTGVFRGNKGIVVPDVLNVSKEDAIQTLKQEGFDTERFTYKEELSETIQKGNVISISPNVGESAKSATNFTIVLSKGVYFVVEDYTGKLYADVEATLKKTNPNLKIKVETLITNEKQPGYILEQKGHKKSDKLDPNEENTITFVVTARPKIQIKGIVGRNVDEVVKELESKHIVAIPFVLSTEGMSDEEIDALKKNVVIRSDPAEDAWYTQEGDNTVRLYYYE